MRRVGGRERGGFGVRRGAGLVARSAEAAHPGVDVGQGAQGPDQLGDVDAGAAVDLRRVLLAEDVDAHDPNLTRRDGRPRPRGPLVSSHGRHAARKKVLAIVLAGGEGKRLMPLTADRAKPAVPFGGIYRLIDFALSNVVNSGYLKVVVLTQYKSHSLDRHVTTTWRMSNLLGNYVTPVPAQQRVGKRWYLGSADAIFQSLNLLTDEQPDIVVVVGADHVYRMDFSQMVAAHVESGAGCTVAAIRQPISLADQFGVIDVDPAEPAADPRLPREADRSDRAARLARRGAGLDGQLRLHRRRAGRRGHPRRRARAVQARHGRRHRAVVRRQVGVRGLRLQGQRGAGLDRPRPRLLARRRDHALLLRRPHGPRVAAAGLQPLQQRVADLHQLRPAPAGQARRGRHAARGCRPSTRSCRPASWSAAAR